MIRSTNPRAAIATIYAEGLVGRLAFSIVSFAMPLYAKALGMSLAQIGILISVRTIFVLPFKPLAGWLADRVGTRAVYLAAIMARTLSAVVLVFAFDFWSLMAVRLLQGASSAGRDVVSLGVIARDAQAKVGSRFGWYSSAKHVGNLAGSGAAGLLIAAFGGRFSTDSFRPLWIIVFGLSIVPLVVAWFGLKEVRDPQPADTPSTQSVASTPVGLEALSANRHASAPVLAELLEVGPERGHRRPLGQAARLLRAQLLKLLGELRDARHALRRVDAPREAPGVAHEVVVATSPATRWRSSLSAGMSGLWGAATVGMLVSSSAYMVHGLFPILATEYAGLNEAQAGVIYMLSGFAFVAAAPTFGWLIDRRGRGLGLALRSICNIGSSVLYVAFPSLAGVAAARVVDDSGKAAFVPAWASLVAEISRDDPVRSGQRIGALDTAATVGEAIGPALATFLWQTGGVVLLFGARILISIGAEVAAIRVFGEMPNFRLPRIRPRSGDA